ncbi:hypothetical protein [Candidatus Spongiihabitans sp.]
MVKHVDNSPKKIILARFTTPNQHVILAGRRESRAAAQAARCVTLA